MFSFLVEHPWCLVIFLLKNAQVSNLYTYSISIKEKKIKIFILVRKFLTNFHCLCNISKHLNGKLH